MIYSTESTQPPSLCLLFGYPPPLCADILYEWSLGAVLVRAHQVLRSKLGRRPKAPGERLVDLVRDRPVVLEYAALQLVKGRHREVAVAISRALSVGVLIGGPVSAGAVPARLRVLHVDVEGGQVVYGGVGLVDRSHPADGPHHRRAVVGQDPHCLVDVILQSSKNTT